MPTAPEPRTPPRVLLIGMMGAGKTTVGRLLADRLGWVYRDSDEEVQRTTGRSVPQILTEDGEAAFRIEERRALRDGVATDEPVVVSVAGGAVLDPDNRRLLRESGTVVWLRVPVAMLALRVGDGTGRPLLGDDPAAALARLYAERCPLYEELADIVVDVESLTPEGVVAEILPRLA